ncbi:MAG: hypothetical protein JRI55_04575 [Deltaproteobacteria bacterium]|nr:hypothetical protein [Deltaproteobacteria bacterium]
MTVVLLAAALLSPAGCGGCEEQDDETALHELVKRGVAHAEKHAVGDLMALTTEDFKAVPRGGSRKEVRGTLMMAFKHYGVFDIRHPRPDIEVDPSGKLATVRVPFLIVRQGRSVPDLGELYDDPQRWLEEVGEIADPYHLQLQAVKRDGEWFVKQARLKGVRSLGQF